MIAAQARDRDDAPWDRDDPDEAGARGRALDVEHVEEEYASETESELRAREVEREQSDRWADYTTRERALGRPIKHEGTGRRSIVRVEHGGDVEELERERRFQQTVKEEEELEAQLKLQRAAQRKLFEEKQKRDAAKPEDVTRESAEENRLRKEREKKEGDAAVASLRAEQNRRALEDRERERKRAAQLARRGKITDTGVTDPSKRPAPSPDVSPRYRPVKLHERMTMPATMPATMPTRPWAAPAPQVMKIRQDRREQQRMASQLRQWRQTQGPTALANAMSAED